MDRNQYLNLKNQTDLDLLAPYKYSVNPLNFPTISRITNQRNFFHRNQMKDKNISGQPSNDIRSSVRFSQGKDNFNNDNYESKLYRDFEAIRNRFMNNQTELIHKPKNFIEFHSPKGFNVIFGSKKMNPRKNDEEKEIKNENIIRNDFPLPKFYSPSYMQLKKLPEIYTMKKRSVIEINKNEYPKNQLNPNFKFIKEGSIQSQVANYDTFKESVPIDNENAKITQKEIMQSQSSKILRLRKTLKLENTEKNRKILNNIRESNNENLYENSLESKNFKNVKNMKKLNEFNNDTNDKKILFNNNDFIQSSLNQNGKQLEPLMNLNKKYVLENNFGNLI